MNPYPTYMGATPLSSSAGTVRGEFVSLESQRFYRIADFDRMAPFFMSLVSGSDHWMFISSTGGLTAGRRSSDNALFPYYTEDRIHDDAGHTGSRTVLRVVQRERRFLWEPLRRDGPPLYDVSRCIYKNVCGNTLVFEEENHDLGLVFRTAWMLSDRFGFVKRSELENRSEAPNRVEVLDGIENILPWGIQEAFQRRFSVLGDAYKQNELDGASGIATYALSSLPGDSPEPAEALRATVCWSTAPPDAARLLSSLQLAAFRSGDDVQPESRICGRRGSFFVNETVELAPGGRRDWLIVADVGYGPGEIARLRKTFAEAGDVRRAVLDDVAESGRRLVEIVARADGLQKTGDTLGSVHHFANVLFNVMRGGVFEGAYSLDLADLKDFVRAFNRATWSRHGAFLESLGEGIELRALIEAAESQGDPALSRLVTEYLPLSFSRRHGDPSRPWNRFSIDVQDRDGSRVLAYEGNWRDIFQNWEALCLSFPEYLEGVIAKFVNTTTADGYNPYRVTKDGYDWEAPSPDDPWAHFGYWGDHQLIYLLKFLEWSRAHHPGRIEGLLCDRRFVYADVPYDIEPYADLLADPRNSISYDAGREARIAARVEAVGFDGRYLADPEGEIHRANLTEKLLVPLLAKLANFVPGAGFWMNTQRPEWNDANNALAGYGASMVTLCYARRYVAFCLDLFAALREGDGVEMHEEVAAWLEGTHAVLATHRRLTESGDVDDRDRKAILDGLGGVAGDYRAGLYASGLGGGSRLVDPDALCAFLELTLVFLDHSIASSERDDGLYHAYNVLEISSDRVGVERLSVMLEGQVAVLSSGALTPPEAVSVLKALRGSELYRGDQHSYLLYPDRELPGFLEKNAIPASRAEGSELFTTLLADGNTDLVERDIEGGLHFNGDFRNIRDVHAALEGLRERGYADLVRRERELVAEIFESVFEHRRFTGRSGTFYGYEGLGCIYWHMVSKLLLAVQESAAAAADDEDAFAALAESYYDVRAGLGFNKPPDVYGAFPTDPYSHTPGFAGARQPGMTGQVKEEIITRLGELGLRVEEGRVRFRPSLLRRSEFLETTGTFAYYDIDGRRQTLPLPPGTLAYTYCQVPVVYRIVDEPGISLQLADGTVQEREGTMLDRAASAELFRRTGKIARVEVSLVPGLEI